MAETKTQAKPEIIQPGHYDDGQEEGRLVANVDIQALTQMSEAEFNRQLVQAHAYPRKGVTEFRRELDAMVCYDETTALASMYALKRDRKIIEGPSIRFAEAAIQAWGNARVGARVIDIGEEFITAQGYFWDLEKNLALAFEVMRRITGKPDAENPAGKRFGVDMIGVTGNAACSIAMRNAIIRGIPKVAWNPSYQKARHLSLGEGGESISVKRENMVKAFAPMGVVKEQIFALLGVKGIDDVTIEMLMFMGGIRSSIQEGEQKVDEVFNPENFENAGQVAPARPKESMFDRSGAKKPDEPKPAAAENSQKPSEPAKTDAAEEVAQDKQREDEAASGGEFAEMVDQAYERLAKLEKMRDVPALRDEIVTAGFMSEDQEKEWIAACDKKIEDFKAAAAAKRAGGK